MLSVENSLGFHIGSCFEGHATGPLGIGALLVVALPELLFVFFLRNGLPA